MPVSPESVGLSSERLGRIERHLQSRYLDRKKIAGTLTLVARRGEVAYLEPLGMRDLERGKPMTEDTLFRIYSMTKPITSVALMMLFEEGHFQLTDPVHRFIPEWRELREGVMRVLETVNRHRAAEDPLRLEGIMLPPRSGDDR